ncbi:hypothetical protein L9F63_013396 [Diploptera punctata]|uniref:Protein O-mannose kinase n=1 Tax=Diploptera punctata TaxID=6984 RepID=A0AAD8ABS7_DIPPU|nr:hypothetical protein L9F63_013396 [Diploptera punctata]
MDSCHQWLTCSDVENVEVKEIIGIGAVKVVYRATWEGFKVAYSKLNNPAYIADFIHGLNMLRMLHPTKHIVQLIGFCNDDIILTEYHKYGNAVNITDKLTTSTIQMRLTLCLNYALILQYLHNSPIGTRVMCDSNDISKLLSQFLITEHMELLLNDVDALPEVNLKMNQSIKCGHRELIGTFVAPEQLWPFLHEFHDEEMPGYDEKTDIWKAASVCDYFLGNISGSDVVRYNLFSVHKLCKSIKPEMRPSAADLVMEYQRVLDEIQSNDL